MTSIIQPEPLELTDGRTVQLLFTAGAAIRMKTKFGVTIESPNQANLDAQDPANYLTVLRIIAACCVKWSAAKHRWVHDPILSVEPEEDLAELIELIGARKAFEACSARSNVGLPRMPAPLSSENGSETTQAESETARASRVNGSAAGLVVELPESVPMSSGI